MNVLNHSRRLGAWAATLSNSPGNACARNASSALAGTRRACASQSNRPSPFPIQSIGVSVGVAIEFRKSRPAASAMDMAGGRRRDALATFRLDIIVINQPLVTSLLELDQLPMRTNLFKAS